MAYSPVAPRNRSQEQGDQSLARPPPAVLGNGSYYEPANGELGERSVYGNSATITISGPETSRMLDEMNNMRRDCVLCDVSFVVQGQKFLAHRLVVSAASRWLAALVQDQEASTTIPLEGLNVVAFQSVLEYMYGEPLQLSVYNVNNLLEVLRTFEMLELERRVWDHLITMANEGNCRLLHATSEMFNCEPLRVVCWRLLTGSRPEYSIAPRNVGAATNGGDEDTDAGESDSEHASVDPRLKTFYALPEQEKKDEPVVRSEAKAVVAQWKSRLHDIWKACQPPEESLAQFGSLRDTYSSTEYHSGASSPERPRPTGSTGPPGPHSPPMRQVAPCDTQGEAFKLLPLQSRKAYNEKIAREYRALLSKLRSLHPAEQGKTWSSLSNPTMTALQAVLDDQLPEDTPLHEQGLRELESILAKNPLVVRLVDESSSSHVEERDFDYKKYLERFYAAHNPEAIERIDEIVTKFEDKDFMLVKLFEKYNAAYAELPTTRSKKLAMLGYREA